MTFAAVVEKASLTLAKEARDVPALTDQHLEDLRKPGTFADVAKSVLGLDDTEYQYLDAMPKPLGEGIRAAIADGIREGRRIQFTYAPSYDFEVRLWAYGDALVVYISGPYSGQPFARDAFEGTLKSS